VETYAARYREGVSKFDFIDVRRRSPGSTRRFPRNRSRCVCAPVPVVARRPQLAYIKNDLLWTIDVDAKGAFSGAPRQLTQELSDCPSWTGDSKTLVYLAIDKLRKVDLASGKISDIPLDLKWANAPGADVLVIRAGNCSTASAPSCAATST